MRKHDQLSDQGGSLSSAAKLARIAQLEAEIALIKGMNLAADAVSSIDNGDSSAESDATLRRFIASNIMPICRCNVHGNIFEVNDAWCKMLGYDREEFVSGAVRWDRLTPDEDAYADQIAISQIKANGKALPFEKSYIRKDGSRVQLLMGVVATDTSGGDCFCFAIEMTERRRIEAEVKESEAKFRLLAEAIPQIVWMAEPTGCVTFHNQRYFDYTGHKREEETTGFEWIEAVLPQDREPFLKIIADAAGRGEGFQAEYRYRSKTGEYRWHLSRGTPLHDAETNQFKFFGTCTDIDDQKQLQEELRESEVRFRTLANAIPQIVWTANPDGQIDFFNDRWFEYTGLTYEQSKNDGWQLLLHPDDLKDYLKGWRNALTTGDSYETEFRLKRAIGLGKPPKEPYRWHLCRAVALRESDGAMIKWFATWTEIEDQKRRKR